MKAKKTTNKSKIKVGGNVVDSVVILGNSNTVTFTEKANKYTPALFPKLGLLPDPGKIPQGSYIPFHRNAVFTGHVNELKLIARILAKNNPKGITKIIVISGMGGIGKTQLAVEFCYRYGRFFHGVHWVDCNKSIESGIAACGAMMTLPNFSKNTFEQVMQTLSAWQDQPRRLVVLDNIDDPNILRDWLPRLDGLHILTTSHRHTWSADLGINLCKLDVLSNSESRVLLRKLATRLVDIQDSELDKVAERLGNLPLALDLASRYLNARQTLTIEEYLTRIEEIGSAIKHSSLGDLIKNDSPTHHETSLETTFYLSWKQIFQKSNNEVVDRAEILANIFFMVSGYLAPNRPIPKDIFYSFADEKHYEEADYALLRLQELGLLSGDISVHPLLCEFARSLKLSNQVFDGLPKMMGVLSDNVLKTGLPRDFIPWRPHLESVAQIAEEIESEGMGHLWNSLGEYYVNVAEYTLAKSAFAKALVSIEKTLGNTHPSFAAVIGNIGVLLQDLGDLQEAKKMCEWSLNIYQKVYGKYDTHVAVSLNNLGRILQDLGIFDEAKQLFKRALEIDERIFGKNHENTVLSINNLGTVLEELGDLRNAKQMFQKALTIDEKKFGKDHPIVASDLSNLAVVLKDMGDLHNAKELLERALKIDELALGKNHPTVSKDVSNLGNVMRLLGNLSEAKNMILRAIQIDEDLFGKNHPKVALRYYNFAILLEQTDNLDDAKRYAEQAFLIFEKSFESTHSNVIQSKGTLERIENKIKSKEK